MHKGMLILALAAAACGAQDATSTLAHPVAPVAPPPAGTAAPVAASPTVVRRVVVSLSRPSGTSVTTTAPDGTITIALDVLENGRGPHVDATLRLAPDGTIASLRATGHHEMGTPVDETFTREGQHVRWTSREEHGERDLTGPAFFVPMSEVVDVVGFLVPAAIKAGGKIDVLPGGAARVDKAAEIDVTSAAGEKRHLVGYTITGLWLTPIHAWMNEDGSWFGHVSPWFSLVPAGFEGVIEPVIAKQTEMDRARDKAIAERSAHHAPAQGIAFTHAHILDVEHGRWNKDETVVVVGDTIRSVGPSASSKVPAGAEVVDLAGKAVLPGLWDMHSHLGDESGALDIASGVTTARDVGNDPDKLDDWKRRYDDGSAVGPHVLRMGFIEGRGEKAASSKITAETEAEAKVAVEELHRRGYEGIKIYNSMKPELVPLLAREAHARGMMVTGHIPVHMLANEAVRAGYDGIEHLNMVFLNFFADHDTDTRTPMRFTLVGDKAAGFDLRSKPVVDFIALLKERRTVVDPTLCAFEDLLTAEQGKVTAGLEPVVDRLPVQARRSFLTGGLPVDDAKLATYRASFAKMLAMVKLLHDSHVTLVAGTDELAGLMLHHELALYVRAGLTPAEALRIDTLEAARAMKLDRKTGTISPGKTADLFVVDGDPLVNIADLARVVSTMRGGVLFASAPLYEAIGVAAN